MPKQRCETSEARTYPRERNRCVGGTAELLRRVYIWRAASRSLCSYTEIGTHQVRISNQVGGQEVDVA